MALKILVIDDERSIRNTLKDILGFEGYQVELAENGKEGIDLVQATDFDIILCDIKMPEMDGLEALEQIRKTKPESTVVMISGHNTSIQPLKPLKGGLRLYRETAGFEPSFDHPAKCQRQTALVKETQILKQKVGKNLKLSVNQPLSIKSWRCATGWPLLKQKY